MLSAVRLRCYALAGVEALAHADALTETKYMRASLQALIAPLDRHQLRSVITVADNVLGKPRGAKLIHELHSEESIFEGLAND